nr:lectin [Nonlabens ulvanivorans]
MINRITLTLLALLSYAFAKAQLQFCDGILGPAIFTEDFGSGTNNGPSLSNAVTSYQYVNAAPQDGEYTISSDSGQLGSWFSFPDHTGNNNGKMLIVNAGFNAGQFYRTPINGLCENTPYEFSAWIMNVLDGLQNVCGTTEIPIQVRFEIWDATDTILLANGTMSPKFADQRPTWIKYGLTFTTSTGQNGVVLKMINVGAGGCGNDLAIDDISFNVCGDDVLVTTIAGETVVTKCENDPAQSIQLNATVQNGAPSLTAYQWQQSADGSNFTDIVGENSFSFTTPPLNSTTYYRVKIAGAPANLTNSSCYSFSQIFEFRNVVVPLAVPRQSPYISCDGELVDLIVDVSPGTTAYWYENATGGSSIHDDSIDYTTQIDGTYWVETEDIVSGCISNSRVPVNFINRSSPIVNSEDFLLCPEEIVLLNTQFPNGFYRWSSGGNYRSY